jgi:hypothetical protein
MLHQVEIIDETTSVKLSNLQHQQNGDFEGLKRCRLQQSDESAAQRNKVREAL